MWLVSFCIHGYTCWRWLESIPIAKGGLERPQFCPTQFPLFLEIIRYANLGSARQIFAVADLAVHCRIRFRHSGSIKKHSGSITRHSGSSGHDALCRTALPLV